MAALRLLLCIHAVPHRTRTRGRLLRAKCRMERADCRQTGARHTRDFGPHFNYSKLQSGGIRNSFMVPITRLRTGNRCVERHALAGLSDWMRRLSVAHFYFPDGLPPSGAGKVNAMYSPE